MEIKDIINIDVVILSGQPVFKGTCVPVESLFDHLKQVFPLMNFSQLPVSF